MRHAGRPRTSRSQSPLPPNPNSRSACSSVPSQRGCPVVGSWPIWSTGTAPTCASSCRSMATPTRWRFHRSKSCACRRPTDPCSALWAASPPTARSGLAAPLDESGHQRRTALRLGHLALDARRQRRWAALAAHPLATNTPQGSRCVLRLSPTAWSTVTSRWSWASVKLGLFRPKSWQVEERLLLWLECRKSCLNRPRSD